jgi:L-ribulose-5-phosphate 3-epimerase
MLLKSLNYWSVPGGLENTADLFAFIDLASRHGFPAVEMAIGRKGALHLQSTQADCAELLKYAAEKRVKVASVASGLYWENSLGDSEPRKRAQAAEELRQMILIAGWLGAPTLLVIPGSVDVFFMPQRLPQKYDEVYEWASEGLRALLPLAEQMGVRLGIENVWNKFLLSPMEMAAFVDQFRSPWIGAYVDVGNILLYGYPEQWLRMLGKRVLGVHLKDFKRGVGTVDGFVDLLEGDVNWPEVASAICEIGYEGPIVAEMIPCYTHHSDVRIANTSRAMDAIFGLAPLDAAM